MIKALFNKTRKPLSEIILDCTRELGKCYSRLELASSKLNKRSENLFNACSFHLKKGSKARATIYANEIAEIRRVLSILQQTQLAVEQAILRLDTLKMVTPTLESLGATFGDVKNALGLVAKVMPSLVPEVNRLNTVVNEILEATQFDLAMPMPFVVNDASTESILQEAASVVEQDLYSRIPEPPVDTKVRRPVKPKPLVALSADGSEIYVDEKEATFTDKGSTETFDVSSFLLEELVMDYIERNNGEMNISRCAKELNLPPAKVNEALQILSRKGKIEIQQ